MLSTRVKLRLDGLKRFRSVMKTGDDPVVRSIKKLWEAKYRAFVVRRFNTYSKGGGDWKPLSPRTIAGRRGKGRTTILVDTGMLRSWLTQGTGLGSYSSRGPWTVDVKYEGGPSHGLVTVGQIAGYHNAGGPNLPKREIFAAPPTELVRTMAQDAERILGKYGRDTVGG